MRWIVVLFLAIFAGVGVLANEPHEHAKHRDCAICSAPTTDRRKRHEGVTPKVSPAGDGGSKPSIAFQVPEESPIVASTRITVATSAFALSSSGGFPTASSVLAKGGSGEPPARAPPHL